MGISTKRIAAIGITNVELLKSMNTGRLPSIVCTFVQITAMSPGFGSSTSSTDSGWSFSRCRMARITGGTIAAEMRPKTPAKVLGRQAQAARGSAAASGPTGS